MTLYQVMPDLSAEQYDALRADIELNGIIVPVVKDQHGNVIDGHNRLAIGAELGVEVPVEIREVTEAQAYDMAIALNCARRHLTREQTRDLIAAEIVRCPEDSDRAIARRVVCSPSTVGTVRRLEDVSNLDTTEMTVTEAEERTAAIKSHLEHARRDLLILSWDALSYRVPVAEVVMALTGALRSMELDGRDLHHVLRDCVMVPVIDYVMDPENVSGLGEFPPADEAMREQILTALRSV